MERNTFYTSRKKTRQVLTSPLPPAGFTYCALGALSFTGRLNLSSHTTPQSPSSPTPSTAPSNPSHLLHWLLSRQTATISPEDEDDTYGDETDTAETCHDAHTFVHQDSWPSKQGRLNYEARPSRSFDVQWLGYNGRCNKVADTCYAFWVGASLDVSPTNLVPRSSNPGH